MQSPKGLQGTKNKFKQILNLQSAATSWKIKWNIYKTKIYINIVCN